MARLINYGPGEISDRLTILALKILVGGEKGRLVEHFETERTALLSQIRSRTLNGHWFETVLELAAVNGQLWQAEDDLRTIRQRFPEWQPDVINRDIDLRSAGAVAFHIQALNDRRAELIAKINKDAGESAGAEKL